VVKKQEEELRERGGKSKIVTEKPCDPIIASFGQGEGRGGAK